MIEILHRYSRAVLYGADCTDVRAALVRAVAAHADLCGADLCSADLCGAYLGGADLRGADLRGAYLGGADLRGADLCSADLCGVDLRGADLRGADLRSAHLRGAHLRGADLGGAYLRGAYLRGAYLRGAYLGGAYLGGAYLRGAYLGGAYLRGADLCDVHGINSWRTDTLRILLDQPGPIRAYKLVNAKFEGPFNGGITYKVGENYEVPDACEDEAQQCAAGISLADLPWCCAEWYPGYRILVAEFTAGDIAAIPTATDGKFRVRRCKIVGEKDLVELGLVEPEAVKSCPATAGSTGTDE